MKRPNGVKIITAWCIIGGILTIAIGLQFLITRMGIFELIIVCVGFFELIVAHGLWSMKIESVWATYGLMGYGILSQICYLTTGISLLPIMDIYVPKTPLAIWEGPQGEQLLQLSTLIAVGFITIAVIVVTYLHSIQDEFG